MMALSTVIGHLSVCGTDPSMMRRNNVRRIHALIDAFPQLEHLRQDYTGETADRTPVLRSVPHDGTLTEGGE
jgi:hypothetical protein